MLRESCDILILSASYGGGHNQVARALTRAVHLLAPGLKIVTVDYCDLLFPLINRLSQFGYIQSLRHFPVGYALYYQATGKISSDSFWQRRLNRMGYSELILLVNSLEPKVIISTFPLPSGVLSEMKESGDLNVPVVTVITDMCVHSQWIHPRTDLYIVGSPEVALGLEQRGVARERIAATGIPILPDFNRTFDKDQLGREFGLKLGEKTVLFMGGSEGLFGTTRLNHIFRDLPANVLVLVITGSNQELYDKLMTMNLKHTNLKILKFVDNMAGLMQVADVLVTKAGGVSMSEALAKGLPMIVYKPAPGHEEANANYLWRHRAAIIAKGEHRLRTAIGRMVADEQFRQRFQRNCLKVATPGSAEAAAKLILKMLSPTTRSSTFYKNKTRSEIRA